LVAPEQTRNRVLNAFASSNPESYARFLRELEPVVLERSAVLGVARARADSVYFVESGIVSLVASTRSGQSLEVAIVGREGVAGIADALGQHPLPYAWIVQVGGLAYRVPTRVIREHILACGDLHGVLMAYSQLLMHQLAQSAVCNRFHTSLQRLARWLLLTAERADTNRLELTHEYMAQMVGAPRSAVTAAAAALRRRHIIDYRRGVLTIQNAARLQKTACECFAVVSWVTASAVMPSFTPAGDPSG
jgi:CRP-like cAMP-binding protein